MKKYLSLLLLLTVVATPVFANTVKQNNYSEELNNTVVNDYVTKRIRVYEEPLPGIGDFNQMTEEEYLNAKQQILAELKSRYAYYDKYFTLKLNSLTSSLERVGVTKDTRSEAEQQAILDLHKKNINELLEQRNQVLGLIQERINKVQTEISTMENVENATQQ